MELPSTKTQILTHLILQVFPIVFTLPGLINPVQARLSPEPVLPQKPGLNPETLLPQKPGQIPEQPQKPGLNPEPLLSQKPAQNAQPIQPQKPGQIAQPGLAKKPGQNAQPGLAQKPGGANQDPLAEGQEFLDAHNKARSHVNQPLYVWSETLAAYALGWANKRIADCHVIHSYGPYGENIFWGAQDHWTATDAVKSWVTEHRFYDRRTNACLPGRLCGHYTQIVWRDSIQLGCARVKCLNGGIFILCSYDPPGNYINENPFKPRTTTATTPTTTSHQTTAWTV